MIKENSLILREKIILEVAFFKFIHIPTYVFRENNNQKSERGTKYYVLLFI